jgi:hypothetical protein
MELQQNNLDRLDNGLVLPQFPTMQACHAPYIPKPWTPNTHQKREKKNTKKKSSKASNVL